MNAEKIIQEFDKQPFAILKNEKIKTSSRLGMRRESLRMMVEHVAKSEISVPVIIETGTAWVPNGWEAMGLSTILWHWLTKQMDVEVYSIDIREEPKKFVEESIGKNDPSLKCLIGNSVQVLLDMDRSLFERVSLLYLDSRDWTIEENMESSHHHLAELCAVYPLLPKGCMIAVDDRHGEMHGKHWMVEKFFDVIDVKPVFKQYQVIWVKP